MDSKRAAAAAVAGAIAFIFFLPTLSFPFLNWDDGEIFVRNAALHAPGLFRWAFTTSYLEHVQPLAWLLWGAIDRMWTLTPAAAHAINVALHALCAALVGLVAERLGLDRVSAVFAALIFGLHPLRVEVVAWASAMPYSLALVFALLSTLAFLRSRTAVAAVLFAASLAARPVALGFPVVLWGLEWWSGSPEPPESPGPKGPGLLHRDRLARLTPFVALSVVAAVLEARARLTSTLAEVGAGARLTLAFTAPFKYAWRTIVPVALTPLDPLALAPRADVALLIASAAALAAISWVAWRRRHINPDTFVAWISYLALLVPAMGLVPSGLQATADRYTYLAAVPLSLWIAAVASRTVVVSGFSRTALASAVILALAIVSYRQMQYWRDSIALWTRAVDVDPLSDVARYNLASALADAGQRDAAAAQYDEVLRIVPDHADARRNRALIGAARLEDEANRLASSGKLDAAIATYRDALALDPARTHSQAALGMALVQIGRTAEAIEPLRTAFGLGASEPAVANALAYSLMMNGRTREACDALEAARARFPNDQDIARNRGQLASECREGR
jgi:Flp pilus assembly protein TadD